MTNREFTIYTSESFLKDMKRFVKKKKFVKLKKDVDELQRKYFKTGDFKGDIITYIDNESRTDPIYKVRMANTTIKVGLSNGFRLIYHVEYDEKVVVLHTIYYKKEEKLSNDDIIRIVQSYME